MTQRFAKLGVFAVLVCIIFAMTLQPGTTVAAINLKSGAVYVLTNQPSNAVAAFDRAPDGTLTSAGTFYTLASSGALTLLNSVAANVGATSFPIDMALNNSSRYLYVLAAGLQTVEAFRVETDGSLTPIGSVGGLPFGSQGIAAR